MKVSCISETVAMGTHRPCHITLVAQPTTMKEHDLALVFMRRLPEKSTFRRKSGIHLYKGAYFKKKPFTTRQAGTLAQPWLLSWRQLEKLNCEVSNIMEGIKNHRESIRAIQKEDCRGLEVIYDMKVYCRMSRTAQIFSRRRRGEPRNIIVAWLAEI